MQRLEKKPISTVNIISEERLKDIVSGIVSTVSIINIVSTACLIVHSFNSIVSIVTL